jgi:hypothetical protein
MRSVPNPNPKILGTVRHCFWYDFEKGDTLLYAAESSDSIMMGTLPTLLKLRREKIMVICDSVGSNPRSYRLVFRTIETQEKQTDGQTTNTRTYHPWQNVTSVVIMDSLGQRTLSTTMHTSETTQRAVIAPGGAFAPLLFPPLDTSCGVAQQSWLLDQAMAMAENGSPPPIINQQLLWRVLDTVDTLGTTFKQIQYTQHGMGYVLLTTNDVQVRMDGKVSGFGKLSFHPSLDVPFHIFAVTENQTEIQMSATQHIKGKHLLRVDYALLERRSAKQSRVFQSWR